MIFKRLACQSVTVVTMFGERLNNRHHRHASSRSAATSTVLPRRAPLAFLIVRYGCRKCYGVTGGAPQVIRLSEPFGLPISISLQTSSPVRAFPRQRVQIDKKEILNEYKDYLNVSGQGQPVA